MTSEEADEEYLDDPITLIDFEQARVNAIAQEIDRSTSKEYNPISSNAVSSYGKGHFTLPVTFFDISSNLKLLSECRPVAIKIVDCDKHPWYYKRNKMNFSTKLTEGQVNNQESHNNSGTNVLSTEEVINNEAISEPEIIDLTKVKIPKGIIVFHKGKRLEYFRSREDVEKKIALKKRNEAKIDFKKNLGLVGLKITPYADTCKPMTSNDSLKMNKITLNNSVNEVDSYILGVDKALHSVGSEIVPLNSENLSKHKVDNKERSEIHLSEMKVKERRKKKKDKVVKQFNKTNETIGNGPTIIPGVIQLTNSSNHIKDKTKTNKYINDLLKKKIAAENKKTALVKNVECSTQNVSNDSVTSLAIQKPAVNNHMTSSKDQPITPIGPGIKSPVFPCSKSTKCSSDKIIPKTAISHSDNISEISREIPKIVIDVEAGTQVEREIARDSVTSIDELSKSNKHFDSKLEQNLSQNTLKGIVISNIMSVTKDTQKTNLNTCITEPGVSNTTTDNAVSISVTTHKPSETHDKIEQNKNVNSFTESYKKIPGTYMLVLPKPNRIGTKREFSNGPLQQRKICKTSDCNSHIQNNGCRNPDQNQNLHSMPDNVAPISNKLPYYSSVKPAVNVNNFMPSTYAHCPDPNKANFEQYAAVTNPQQHLFNVNSKNMFWPYWPVPPPLPPPSPPPPLSPQKIPQNISKNPPPPPSVQITSVEVITGYGKNRKDAKNLMTRNCVVGSIKRDNNKVVSACVTPVKQVNSKSEMLEELQKEMMTISNTISAEFSVPMSKKIANDSQNPKTLPGKVMSNTVNKSPKSFRYVRPGPNQFKHRLSTQNQMFSHDSKSASQPYLNANQKTSFESSKEALSKSLNNNIEPSNNSSNYYNNHNGNGNTSLKKNPFSYLIGTKVNSSQPKIAPLMPKVGPMLKTNDMNTSHGGGRTEEKASIEASKAISNGYSPPILPIPTYESSLDFLYSNTPEVRTPPVPPQRGKSINNIPIKSFYLPSRKKSQSLDRKVTGKRHLDNDIKPSKKISIEEYKDRVLKPNPIFQGTTDTLPIKRSKCRKDVNSSKAAKTLAEIINPIAEQDLGYDSDSTVKL